MPRHIYATGYANWPFNALLEKAKQLDAVIVDIRLVPRSRKSEWRQGLMMARLRRRYLHIRQWGNLKYKGGPIQVADFPAGKARLQAALRIVDSNILHIIKNQGKDAAITYAREQLHQQN